MSTSQNVNPEDIKATVAAIEATPELANVSFTLHSDWTGGFCASSRTGKLVQAGNVDESRDTSFALASDEPPALLGQDSAPSAGDYVLKALAACYAVTLAANAASRGIELDSVHFDLEGDFDLHGFLGLDEAVRPGLQELRVAVDIDSPNATREQLTELVEAVQQRSPIRDTLANPVPVVTTLADAPAA
ncbi:MAG: OsmC family protein [Actinobacteria bacterium]|nr:OsmC family protein [Actinomycetota bacterium]